jgi:hypothetical protein
MREYTIAEILHIAADKYLASKESQQWKYGGCKDKYSCCAVSEAVHDLYNNFKIGSRYDYFETIERIYQGLRAMGCPTGSLEAFNDRNEFNEENQQARYAWLKFAAMMAEEQGV